MGHAQRQLEQLQNIARLRRAQRRLPANEDLSAVRSTLERELGETVSQRQAARLLAVSHTALARWIKAGDLPVVTDPSGRSQVPVAALLDLYEQVTEERRRGRRHRHLLEPTLLRGRERAKRLSPAEIAADVDGHDRAEQISLAYHRALARRLNRAMVEEARHRVSRWQDQGRLDRRYAARWRDLLGRPLAEIRERIGEDSQEARDLRQNSPLAGMLSEPERRRIVEELT